MPCDFLPERGASRTARAILPTALLSAAGVAMALLCSPALAQDSAADANKPVLTERPVQWNDAATSDKGERSEPIPSTDTVTTGNNALPAVNDGASTKGEVESTSQSERTNAGTSNQADGGSDQTAPAEGTKAGRPAAMATGEDGGGKAALSPSASSAGETTTGTEARKTEAGTTTAVDTPSLLDDPAGALKHILARPERRADLPHDLSPWGMFMNADIVVKVVMIGLGFASLVTWTVWLAKMLELAGARTRAGRTLKVIRSARTLNDAVRQTDGRGGPAALMLRAAKEEAELSEAAIDHAGGAGLKERVSSSLGRIESFAGRRISKGTGVLATIGSTAPFVGLFGTVWGIMNAFIGISEAQTTNLAVVAPGIAEALLATALGLVAAIPAVIIYNVFARSITGYRQLLADAATGVERLISRDIDFRAVPASTGAASLTGRLEEASSSRAAE